MLKDRLHLGFLNTGKPLKKVMHCRAVLKILKQRTYWNPGALENPGVTDLLRRVFH
jgi:hypothetical protein